VAATPTQSGLKLARELLRTGLSIDGEFVRGAPGSDIFRARVGRRLTYVIRRPDYVDHVLHAGADRYQKSVEYELLRALLGLNLFTDEGDSWRRHRMMLNPVMAKRHVKGMCGLMIEPIEAFVADQAAHDDTFEIEMASAMTALTLDVVGAALFGQQFGDLALRMRKVVTGGLRASERATRVLMIADPPRQLIRAWAAFVHHAPLLPRSLARVQWVMKTIDETVWDVVDERRRDPTDADDLLNLLLNAEDEHGKLGLRRVRDEVTTFMLAGHETTANALAWTWYLLSQNHAARDRMLAEIDGVLEGRRPTVEDIPHLPWTTACFQEGMRIYPPAWSIPRTAIEDDEIDGHRIPRGATVIIPIYSIHHDKRFWPEPETFDPERFLAQNAKGRHRSAYLPFGGGRRVCIGSSFALMEATLIMAMMSQRFVYHAIPEHPVEPEATLTLRPRHGVKMVARRR
jgi:cytochrome P450